VAFNPFKLTGLGKSLRTLAAILGVLFLLALATGIYALIRKQAATVAGGFYSYQLQLEHGLSLGSPYEGETALVSYLEARGFSLLRRLKDDNFEFESPGNAYLLRVKTHRGHVSSIYHYLHPNSKRPQSRPCFLGCSPEELKQKLGAPSAIEKYPVPSYRYELADAVLTIVFGDDGWVVETDLQRPIVHDQPAASD
jgi:hypothetical protein